MFIKNAFILYNNAFQIIEVTQNIETKRGICPIHSSDLTD